MLTFRCDFGGGVACEVRAPEKAPHAGSRGLLRVEWVGQPTPAMIPHYIAWMNSVNETCANKWSMRFVHAYMRPDGRIELWAYEPGKAPTRLE